MLFLRKVFCYIFILIYIITCPIIILYALGYIFKPHAEEYIQKTGDVSLATLPPGASIYVNGKLSENITPYVLDQLLPGEYDVKIDLSGYHPWAATLPVKAGVATVLEKIILLPTEWQANKLLTGEFNNLIYLPKTSFFLVAKDPALKNHLIYDYKKKATSPMVEPSYQYAEYNVLRYFTSKNSQLLLLHVSQSKTEKYLLIDLGETNPQIKDITGLFPEKPDYVLWDPGDKNSLFALHASTVYHIDITSNTVDKNFLTKVRGFGIKNKLLYVLSAQNVLVSMDYKRKNIKTLFTGEDFGNFKFDASQNFLIMSFSSDSIVVLGTKGQMLIKKPLYSFSDTGVKGVEFDENHNLMLIWKRTRIAILDFTPEATGQKPPVKKDPEPAWVYTAGNNIEQAFWAYDASHIIFRDGTKILLIGHGDHRVLRKNLLFQTKDKSWVFYIEENGLLYYLEPQTGYFDSMAIVPHSAIIADMMPSQGEKKTNGK